MGTKVVDIDGSNFYKKRQKLLSEGMMVRKSTDLPRQPLIGWDSVNTANHKEMASTLPSVIVSLISKIVEIFS